MFRSHIISALSLFAILALNGLALLSLNKRYVTSLNENLQAQTQAVGEQVERKLLGLTQDMDRQTGQEEFSALFKDPQVFSEVRKDLQVYYAKYDELITKISVYDNKRNFYAVYREVQGKFNASGEFAEERFTMRRQQRFHQLQNFQQDGNTLQFYHPFFDQDQITGYVVVEVKLAPYFDYLFELYPRGNLVDLQYVLDSGGAILMGRGFDNDSILIGALEELVDSIETDAAAIIEHEVYFEDGRKERMVSSLFPISVYTCKMGILFSVERSKIFGLFLHRNLAVILITQLLATALVIYLLLTMGRHKRDEKKIKVSEIMLRQILEAFPMGILILDQKNIIRHINSAAQGMLFLSKDTSLEGKDFSKQFLVSNKYLLSDSPSPFLDESHYLYYEKEGIETVIYRSEKHARIGGEELRLVSLIDVSPLEKSRKGEVAANKAKSDFLAAMSHEIRTPMNGILGMVNSLLEQADTQDLRGKIEVIKRSAELLMNIINDILDFSKIEAGRMMLEEIPFILDEEMDLVGELFRPLAEEKNLELEIEIDQDVPNKLIGDPFRLRQVISNLVSNAVKFTERGRIVIGVKLMESYKSHVNILFTVEDTGIGIPKDRIKEIFGSYTQARGSVQRKFGGTGLGTAIAKQLVELMHGEIWVESPSAIGSEESPGSKFSFTIDAYSNERIPKEFDFHTISKLSDIHALILTKESDPERHPMARMLTKFGLQVATKIYQDSTVDSIIHHLQVHAADYQLIILVDKNQLDGFALAQEIQNKGLTSQFPIVLVSSNDKSGNYKTCRKLGIDYYLIDPFETKEVTDILDENFPGIEDRHSLEPLINALPVELSILLAEDNLINQKVAQSIFKNIGYEIEIAKHGMEAIEMVDRKKYDVIFMDLLMPEMDGYQAAGKIREAGHNLPIIALSADETEDTKKAAFKAGMNEYLLKPARVESIKQLLIKLFSTTV